MWKDGAMAISSERIIGILEENGFTLCRVKESHHPSDPTVAVVPASHGVGRSCS